MVFITTDSPFFVGPNITNATTDPTLAAHDIIDSIGTRGQGHEKGLQMLQDCMDFGDCQNWMRPNAILVAIFVADELDGGFRVCFRWVGRCVRGLRLCVSRCGS